MILPLELCMQSRELSVVRWNIFLCMVFCFMLSSVLYFVMAVLQLSVVCLVTILYAWALAFLPILAMLSIHCMYCLICG